MTTVAWDGTSLAADRRATSSGCPRKVQKLFRLPDGGLIAFAGDFSYGRALYKWLAGKGPKPSKVPHDADQTQAIVISPKGRASIIQGESFDPGPLPGAWAIGSGRDFALMAMDLGLSAEEAVRRAAKFDIFTGNGVCVMQPGK